MADEPHNAVPPHTEDTPLTELTQQDAQTELEAQMALKEYAAALRQEFQETQEREAAEAARRPQDVEKAARDLFRTHAEEAALQIVWLAQNSDSESIRLRASMTVLKEAFEEGRYEGDPIKDLINNLFSDQDNATKDPQPSAPKPDAHSGNQYTHEELMRAIGKPPDTPTSSTE